MTAYPASFHNTPSAETLAAPNSALDASITAAVELLLMKKGVCTRLLEVKCREGIVELVGFTHSLLSRERAAYMAKTVHGVRGVINKISIRTLEIPDAELQNRAEQALLQDPVARYYKVSCHGRSGELTVAGSLPSEAARQAVLRVLKGVSGVRQINNRLRVQDGETRPSDEEITARIQEFLVWGNGVKCPLIHARTVRGVVQLTGTLGTAAERDQIVAAAYLAGAACVDARNLVVAYWAIDQTQQRERIRAKLDKQLAKTSH
ncbi:BON domain-containing protein [Hymenobacter sp. BT683]|uniref:BON domain-containing protein n=1 Tax=Hymenobacter jeongseonensis TaxID=2791027 RepID=A0ABS0IL48_9BACT|nr:BON domain-containing protein [Hymenobacter jeongseonensis]MBF9238490.1 BON domain-containing protein [Hymenobacter jeongseonensis]